MLHLLHPIGKVSYRVYSYPLPCFATYLMLGDTKATESTSGGNLMQFAGLHVENEAPDRNVFWDPWMGFQFLDLLPDILFQVAKSMKVNRCHGCSTCLLLELRTQFLILESQHPAVSVMN